LFALGILLGRTGAARAQPGNESRPADTGSSTVLPVAPRAFVIEVNVVGSPARFEEAKGALGTETLLGGKLRWSRLNRLSAADLLQANLTPELRVRCFIDLSTHDQITLYFVDRSSRRFLHRELSIPNDFDALERETLAQIMEFSVSALLDESTVALSRDEAVALLRPPVQEKAADDTNDTTAQTTNAERVWAPGTRVAGRLALEEDSPQLDVAILPGVSLGAMLSKTSTRQLGLQFVASQKLARTHRGVIGGAELSGLQLRMDTLALVPLLIRDDPRRQPGVGFTLGAGFQRLHVVPVEGYGGAGMQLLEPRSVMLPFISAGIRFYHGVGPGFAVALGGSLDVAIRTLSCDVELDGKTLTLFSTRRVSPSLFVELSWEGGWQLATDTPPPVGRTARIPRLTQM
jgi:hypothetical protein